MPITKIDRRGRITIPKEIRRDLDLKEDDELLIFKLSNNILMLRKANLQQLINEALEEFKKIKDKDIKKIEEEVNKLAKEKLEVVFRH
ncbi:hypothetical protein DRP05_13460 [Archaeoglobales archaeon]|mgnify:CR=1 FL=1|nr:MAG: hypothetical protein DRP05_13460 [Archaeoglobales archaeon]